MGVTLLDFGDFAAALAIDFGELTDFPIVATTPGTGVPFAVVPSGAVLGQSRNQARRYGLILVDPTTGNSLAGTLGSATATRAIVWGGGTGPALASPATSWADATSAELYLDVLPGDLANLESQPYPLIVEVLTAAGWMGAWAGTLRPRDSRGTTPPPPVYTDYASLEDMAGDTLDQLQSPTEGAGLLRSRVKARQWLDKVLLARYRPAGFACGGFFSPSLGVMVSPEAPNPILKGYLDAGYLVLTDQVRDIAVAKALGFAFGRQLGAPDLLKLSTQFHRWADNEVGCLVAQIDTNGDGYPEIVINCGLLSARSY